MTIGISARTDQHTTKRTLPGPKSPGVLVVVKVFGMSRITPEVQIAVSPKRKLVLTGRGDGDRSYEWRRLLR